MPYDKQFPAPVSNRARAVRLTDGKGTGNTAYKERNTLEIGRRCHGNGNQKDGRCKPLGPPAGGSVAPGRDGVRLARPCEAGPGAPAAPGPGGEVRSALPRR